MIASAAEADRNDATRLVGSHNDVTGLLRNDSGLVGCHNDVKV